MQAGSFRDIHVFMVSDYAVHHCHMYLLFISYKHNCILFLLYFIYIPFAFHPFSSQSSKTIHSQNIKSNIRNIFSLWAQARKKLAVYDRTQAAVQCAFALLMCSCTRTLYRVGTINQFRLFCDSYLPDVT